jgi:hypothetical protein
MTTVHKQESFYAGDQWEIDGRLYDRDHSPLNLTGATIEWFLRDAAGDTVYTQVDATVTVTDAPNGLVNIKLSSLKTAALPIGRYTDVFRVSSGSIPKETLWTGTILVKS